MAAVVAGVSINANPTKEQEVAPVQPIAPLQKSGMSLSEVTPDEFGVLVNPPVFLSAAFREISAAFSKKGQVEKRLKKAEADVALELQAEVEALEDKINMLRHVVDAAYISPPGERRGFGSPKVLPDGSVMTWVRAGGVHRTAGGRITFRRPALQNWPFDLRVGVVAEPGHLLADVDIVSAHVLFAAALSGDTVLLDAVKTGKVYESFAASMNPPLPRKVAKRAMLIWLNGGKNLHTRDDDAARKWLAARYPTVSAWKDSASALDAWESPWTGQTVRPAKHTSPKTGKAALSFPSHIYQHVEALLIDAMMDAVKAEEAGRVLLPMYDGFLMEVPEDGVDYARLAVERAMLDRWKDLFPEVSAIGIVPEITCRAGRDWGEASGHPGNSSLLSALVVPVVGLSSLAVGAGIYTAMPELHPSVAKRERGRLWLPSKEGIWRGYTERALRSLLIPGPINVIRLPSETAAGNGGGKRPVVEAYSGGDNLRKAVASSVMAGVPETDVFTEKPTVPAVKWADRYQVYSIEKQEWEVRPYRLSDLVRETELLKFEYPEEGQYQLSSGRVLTYDKAADIWKSMVSGWETDGVTSDAWTRTFFAWLAGAATGLIPRINVRPALLFLVGAPNGGKTTVAESVAGLFQLQAKAPLDLGSFNGAQAEYYKASLAQVSLAYSTEIGTTHVNAQASAIIKSPVTGDTIYGREIRETPFSARGQASVLLAGNHIPTFAGPSGDIRDRIVVLPVGVPSDDQKKWFRNISYYYGGADPRREFLPTVLALLLSKAVEGMVPYLINHREIPRVGSYGDRELAVGSNVVLAMLDDMGLVDDSGVVPDLSGGHFVSVKTLYEAFQVWTRESGQAQRMSRKTFIQQFALATGLKRTRKQHQGTRLYGFNLADTPSLAFQQAAADLPIYKQ